jgi:hypothetical protein
MEGAKMDYKVELVAQAFYEADPVASLWDNEPAVRKEEFREFARNAINLLNDDIGVLLLALEDASAEERVKGTRLAA